MLLQHLNDFANSRKLLDNLAFKPKAVRWIITLDKEGHLVGQGPVETEGGKATREGIQLPANCAAQGSRWSGRIHGGRHNGRVRARHGSRKIHARKEAERTG